jgi:hypothetical protein
MQRTCILQGEKRTRPRAHTGALFLSRITRNISSKEPPAQIRVRSPKAPERPPQRRLARRAWTLKFVARDPPDCGATQMRYETHNSPRFACARARLSDHIRLTAPKNDYRRLPGPPKSPHSRAGGDAPIDDCTLLPRLLLNGDQPEVLREPDGMPSQPSAQPWRNTISPGPAM